MVRTNKPNISAVIPTYNRAATIEKCINSVQNQTVPIKEILVIDDCSTDDTLEILKTFKDISILSTTKKSGAQAARNIGIKSSQCEWIAFLDSDDEWLPDKMEKQIDALERIKFDPRTVVHGDCIVNNLENDSKKSWPLNKIDGENVHKQLLSASGTFFPAILTSKYALKTIGYLDESIAAYQEWDTSIQLSKFCNFIHIQEALFIYNIQSDSISNEDYNNVNGYLAVVKKYEKDIIALCGKKVYYDHLINCSNMASNNGNFIFGRDLLRAIDDKTFKSYFLLLLNILHVRPKYIYGVLKLIK